MSNEWYPDIAGRQGPRYAAIADEIGDLEDLRTLVVVSENDRVFAPFQLLDLDDERRDPTATVQIILAALVQRREPLEQRLRLWS